MREPPYTRRTKRFLTDAARWAVDVLYLKGWSITIFFDHDLDNHPRYTAMLDCTGLCGTHLATWQADILIRRSECMDQKVDPLFTLFHEMTHVVLAYGEVVDPPGVHGIYFEQTCSRMARVLYRLWKKEHK